MRIYFDVYKNTIRVGYKYDVDTGLLGKIPEDLEAWKWTEYAFGMSAGDIEQNYKYLMFDPLTSKIIINQGKKLNVLLLFLFGDNIPRKTSEYSFSDAFNPLLAYFELMDLIKKAKKRLGKL